MIKWPNEVEQELVLEGSPPEDNTVGEFTEGDAVGALMDDTDINQPTDVTTVRKGSGTAQPLENPVIENKPERLSRSDIEKSDPPCLTDLIDSFTDSYIYDLMQNANGRIIVSAFLNAFAGTVSNTVSSSMYLHVSRQFKNLLKDSKGSRSISIISNAIAKLLTDERAAVKLNTSIENIKMTLVRPETTLHAQNIKELATSLITRPKSRRIFRALSEGMVSVFKLPDPKNAIVKGFQDLRAYTWPKLAPEDEVVT